MNENDLRQAFALMLIIGVDSPDPKTIWKMADALVAAQYEEPEPEIGIVAVKKRKTK